MFHLSTISKKLTLSPRPRRRLERQKKALSFHDDVVSADSSTPSSPRLSHSSHALHQLHSTGHVTQSIDAARATPHAGFRRGVSVEASAIQIVVDSPDTPPQRYPMRCAVSDPINPNLLTVRSNSHSGCQSSQQQQQQYLTVSLPASPAETPPDSPGASPGGSPSLFRRRLSWRSNRTKSSPIEKRQSRIRHSQSFSELLRGKRAPAAASKFSLDASMLSDDRLYWVVTVHPLAPTAEFEVSSLGTVMLGLVDHSA